MSFLSFTLSVNVNVLDGAASLAEVISNKFVSPVFDVHKVFFDTGVKGTSSQFHRCRDECFWCNE